jgi:hypothetical protein
MIVYEHLPTVWRLWQYRGTVIEDAFAHVVICNFITLAIYLIVKVWKPGWVSQETMDNGVSPEAWKMLMLPLGFLLSLRTNQAYGRFVQGVEAYTKMVGDGWSTPHALGGPASSCVCAAPGLWCLEPSSRLFAKCLDGGCRFEVQVSCADRPSATSSTTASTGTQCLDRSRLRARPTATTQTKKGYLGTFLRSWRLCDKTSATDAQSRCTRPLI